MPVSLADRALYCKFAGDRCRLSSVGGDIPISRDAATALALARSKLLWAAGRDPVPLGAARKLIQGFCVVW